MKSTIQFLAYFLAVMVVMSTNVAADDSNDGADNVKVTAANPADSVTEKKATGQKTEQKSGAGKIKLRKGAKIYVDNCRICHGDRGNGDTRARGGLRPPPRDFTTIEAALELTEERMIKSVTEGRPGTGMMAHKGRLSEQEIKDVVDFIRTSFMRTPRKNDVVVKNIEGRKIYTKNCSVCHGDNGNTAVWARSGLNPPPRDFTAAESAQVLTRERMIKSVTEGRPGTGMMPFSSKLSNQQIGQVVDYIREAFLGKAGSSTIGMTSPDPSKMLPQDRNHARMRQQGGGMPTAPSVATRRPVAPGADPHANMPMMAQARDAYAGGNAGGNAPHRGPMALQGAGMSATTDPMPAIVDADMSLPMPGGLKGDVAAGRKFFMNNCFTCHGVTGEGNGPRASFNIPRPRNFTTDESRRMFNRVRLFNSITNGRVGTVMPAWSKVLTPQQIANIAEFVFQEFIQSKKAGDTKKKKKKAS